MEPTNGQFSNIYRKGGDQSGLEKRALDQRIQEVNTTRKLNPQQRFERDVESGVQGARNVVNLNPTIKEATDNPDMLGGPVSGAALAKEKRMKVDRKKTTEREMKRR
jgi:hypothetical protein